MSLIHSTHAEKRKRLEKKRRQNTIVMILALVLAYAVVVIVIISISMVEQRKLLVSPWSIFKSDLSSALTSLSFLCSGEDVPFRIEYACDIILALAVVALVLMVLKFVVEGILCFLKHLIGESKRRSRQRAVKAEQTTLLKDSSLSPKESLPPPEPLTTKNKRKQQTPKVPLKQTLKNLPQKQKVFLGLAVVAEALLALLFLNGGPDFSCYRSYASPPDGFFTFLRIATCAALVGLLLEKLSFWLKFPLLLLAILYNPVIPIRLYREEWFLFNIVTIPMLAVPWIILLRRLRRKDAAPESEEVS